MNAYGSEISHEVMIGTGPAKMGSIFLMPTAMVTSYLIMLSWTPVQGYIGSPLAIQRYIIEAYDDHGQLITTHALYGSDTRELPHAVLSCRMLSSVYSLAFTFAVRDRMIVTCVFLVQRWYRGCMQMRATPAKSLHKINLELAYCRTRPNSEPHKVKIVESK